MKDTGKGIPQEDLPSIFKPFYQSSNNQLIGQGVGLGLHISKQLVEFLGGEISIETELGHGSTFSFEIPRRNADPVSLAAPSPLIRNYEGQRRKILVVDDEPLNRSMLREFLSTVGLEATEADSPEKAFSLIKNGFDAMISDIRMPGYDGHTFCRNLRSSAETKDLIIIACSASVFADDQRLALDSGFSDFQKEQFLPAVQCPYIATRQSRSSMFFPETLRYSARTTESLTGSPLDPEISSKSQAARSMASEIDRNNRSSS